MLRHYDRVTYERVLALYQGDVDWFGYREEVELFDKALLAAGHRRV